MSENQKSTLAKINVSETTAQTLALCSDAIRKHHTSRMIFSNSVTELLQNNDKAAEEMREFYKKIHNQLKEHQNHFENKLQSLLIDRQNKCAEATAAIDKRALRLREMKSELENMQAHLSNESNPSAKDLMQLHTIRDELRRLCDDNEKTASREIANDLTEIGCTIVPEELETLNRLINCQNNALIYVNACHIKPHEVLLQIRDTEFPVGQTFDVFVISTITSNLFISCVRVESVNYSTNTVERLNFKMAFPTSVSFEFCPPVAGEYEIRAYLYERPVTGSPLRIVVGEFVVKSPEAALPPPQVSNADILDLSAQMKSTSILQCGRGIPLLSGNSQQDNGVVAGVGRGNSSLAKIGGRGRVLDSSVLLRTPGFNITKQTVPFNDTATNSTFESDASATGTPVSVVDVKSKDIAVASNNLNSAVSSTNGYRNYMGRLLDTVSEPTVPLEVTRRNKLKNKSLRSVSRNDNVDVSTGDANSSEEDWDAVTSNSPILPQNDYRSVLNGVSSCFAATNHIHSNRYDLTPLIKRGGISAKLVLNLGKMGQSEPAEAFFKMPIGCASNLRLGHYIICDTFHNAVKVFTLDGKPKLMIDGNGVHNPDLQMNRPSAVVVLDDNTFVVKDNTQLYKFSPAGELLDIFGSGRFQQIYGLCKTNRNILLTLDLHRQRSPSLPKLYGIDSETGKILSENEFSACGNTRGSKCYFMDCVEDQLVVADLGLSRGYVCDIDGAPKFTFGEIERVRGEPGKFHEPSGVALDAVGNILIGDSRNDRVQIWSKHGVYLGTVHFNSPIIRPSNIHLTDDGHLLVMNYIKHFVSVFKLEPLSQ